MNKKNRPIFVFFIFLLLMPWYSAQEVFSQEEFLAVVKKFHPIMKQTKLQNQIAKNQIQAAKGNLDPVISGKLGEKVINGLGYYNQKGIEMVVPTWYGVNIVGSINQLNGNKLDNSDTKGNIQQIGVEIPLGKGLLFDQRRAAIQQAKVFAKMTENEQNLIINDLLLEANNSYINWWKSHEILKVNENGYQNNLARLKMIRRAFELGERPAIDTTEAKAQVQFFELKVNEAKMAFRNAAIELSSFLWNDNENWVQIPENVIPETTMLVPVLPLENQISKDHLALQYYRNKQDFLEIERKLKFQSLLPKLDFSYNFIRKDQWQFLPVFQDNFQYGLKLEIPLFLRTARADYQNAKLKLQQNEWDFRLKENDLNVKFLQYKNEFENYNQQNELAEKNVVLYQQLMNGENTRFMNGEGSVFLINSREIKLLEGMEKQIELKAKQIQTYNKIRWVRNDWVSTL